MTNKCNALTALAEQLKSLGREDGPRLFPTASDRRYIRKAQRIAMELSKIGNLYNNEGWPPEVDPRMMILRCRAIAEEEAEDSK